MAKPTGTLGYFCALVGVDGDVTGSFVKTDFSPDKPAAEKQIAEYFFGSMNKHLAPSELKFCLSDLKQNPENRLDFTVSSPNGPAYLELMEIAPLKGPYDTAPGSYNPYLFAKAILSGIFQKSDHYSTKKPGLDLYLLLYVTHWAFTLSGSTMACLRYWLKAKPSVFRAVFFYQPLEAHEGAPYWLFPVPPELIGTFDPEQIRDSVVINMNPQSMKIHKENGS